MRLQDLEAHIGPLSTVRSVCLGCSSPLPAAEAPDRLTAADASQVQVPEPEPVVLVISGPSGVGKDAVLRRLQELRPDLYFVVTATTRCFQGAAAAAAPALRKFALED